MFDTTYWIVMCLIAFFIFEPSASYSTWNNRHYTNDKEYYEYQAPITHTQYKYRTVQTGSAIVPHLGQKVYVGPDHNKTKAYLAKIETTIINQRKKLRRPLKSCVKCPSEKMVIAQRRLDGVLIEPPPALTCSSNQPYSKSLYEVVTLFGSKFMFVLPQGTHSFIGKVINKKTNVIELSCTLKYKVIVRQCIKYRTRNWDLRTKCDLGSIWGSECTFTCQNGGSLSHNNPIVCGDDLEWAGDEPNCYTRNDYMNDEEININTNQTSSCELPIPPTNGKFSCDINSADPFYDNNDLHSPTGSICHINCNRHFEIPVHMQPYSQFYCENGQWNSTMMNFCQRRDGKGR